MPEQLVRLFEDSRSPGTCKACDAAMEWYETLAGRNMPMNRGAVPRKSEKDGRGRVVAFFSAEDSHWTTCPQRDQFRRKG